VFSPASDSWSLTPVLSVVPESALNGLPNDIGATVAMSINEPGLALLDFPTIVR
tara:strand:+ start:404 stop:565 length:162 start_codon:yes stop_codon:yes gene_type:complete